MGPDRPMVASTGARSSRAAFEPTPSQGVRQMRRALPRRQLKWLCLPAAFASLAIAAPAFAQDGGTYTPPPGGQYSPPPGGSYPPPPGGQYAPPPGGQY